MIDQIAVLFNISRCAYEAGISRSYLSQLEKGTFYASPKIVDKLAKALDVSPAELLKS
jgi:transcriptional regulator with XRE-family HTH domain